MREILFRGKRVDNEKWIEGSLVNNIFFRVGTSGGVTYIINPDEYEEYNCMEDIGELAVEVILETVGQYTGLTDKNGKKIFEGDIVAKDVFQKRERIDSDGNKLHVFEINKPKIQKTAVVEYCSKRGKFDTGTPEICFDFASDFYIIGNIHDNPELVEAR